MSAQRWNVSTNKADDDGTAVKITYSFSIAPVANKNDKTVMIQYKNGETWTTLATYTDSYGAENKMYISSAGKFSTDNAYSFRVLVKDYFTTDGVAAYAAIVPSFKLLDFSADGKGIGVGCKAESGKLKVDMPLEAQSYNGYTFDFDTENQTDTWIPVLKDGKLQHRVMQPIGWSAPVTLGNACGITFKYRYNGYFVFLSYDGSFSNNTGFSAGTGYSPGDGNLPSLIGGIGNFFSAVVTDNRYRLAIRYYPSLSSNKLALISMDSVTVAKGAYITGFVMIPRVSANK